MKTLDCETYETTLASIAKIYELNETTVIALLESIQFTLYDWRKIPFEDYIFKEFELAIGKNGTADRTIWFHLTRCKSGNMFEDGILPLNLMLPKIHEEVDSLIDSFTKKEKQKASPKSTFGRGDSQYGLKTSNPIHWGPYAMLMKQVAFVPTLVGNHDYLEVPEIVEDICNGLDSNTNSKVLAAYKKSTTPCIIKFWVNGLDRRCLVPAVCYLYNNIINEEFSRLCNTCFDAGGVVIPNAQILKIEYLSKKNIGRKVKELK